MFIVKLHAAFQSSSQLYMVLEYCSGQDLRKYLLKERKFSESKCRFYSGCILVCLKYLHEINIVYRDLKPENIVIDKDGYAKLTDFGLSKDGVSQSTEGTQTVLGSFQYIAPEVLKGQGYGKAMDWFLFGILVYEMLTGRTPFLNLNECTTYDQMKQQKIYIPEDLSLQAKTLISQVIILTIHAYKIEYDLQLYVQLLQFEPQLRLGSGPMDADEIIQHPFFSELSFEQLNKKSLQAPSPYLMNNLNGKQYQSNTTIPNQISNNMDYIPNWSFNNK